MGLVLDSVSPLKAFPCKSNSHRFAGPRPRYCNIADSQYTAVLCRTQCGHSGKLVGGGDEAEAVTASIAASKSRYALIADGVEPAEDFLNALSAILVGQIARVTRSSDVCVGAAPGLVDVVGALSDMCGAVALAKLGISDGWYRSLGR